MIKYSLIRIDKYSDIDPRLLMDVYAESNAENTEYFFPDMDDKTEAVKKVEEGFLDFLKNDFFKKPGNLYWILEKDGIWLAALRTSELEDRTFYIEALETHPAHRRQGNASRLIEAVIEELKAGGSFRLCDCVDKENEPSAATHLSCGFKIAEETGNDLLSGELRDWEYSFEFRYDESE